MTISGLENNYYLTQNDIWISVSGFTEVVSKVVIDFKNLFTNEELNGFECSAGINNDCLFNVCLPIRSLMPNPNHMINNNLQSFQIKITAKFKNPETPDDVVTISKYFVRGGRNKNGVDEWYLNDGDYLVVNYWVSGGVSWSTDSSPQKISGSAVINGLDYPLVTTVEERKGCNGIVVKYLNSLGGYQYFYFDRYEIKEKTKSDKTIQQVTTRLRNDNFQNIGYDETRTLTLFCWTEKKLQANFMDLIKSPHIFYKDLDGDDPSSQWHLIQLDDNSSVFNNYENVYENKAEFTLPNYRTIKL